ncbi:MAG: hypothetical protein KBT30_02505 [Clostridiales bacterium]|nr:hypothetical protein [Candidatus Apopatousia equi]
MKNFSVGEVVSSSKGRDLSQFYMVYKFDGKNLLLVNGSNKTLLHPKAKNSNHVISHQTILENIKSKLENGKVVYDAEIYSALKKFKELKKGE